MRLFYVDFAGTEEFKICDDVGRIFVAAGMEMWN